MPIHKEGSGYQWGSHGKVYPTRAQAEKQAAAAYANGYHESKGGEIMDHELLDQVADELLQAIEKKDKAMLLSALEALVLHIQDMDAEQDAEDMEKE